MTGETQRFTIRATASRIEKGLLAVPQRFRDWFPREKGPIQVAFDDEEDTKAITFHPYDPVAKENRIFGLGQWISKRGIRDGDVISITIEDTDRPLYRIALGRYVREREEQKARHGLTAARTDSEAVQELSKLSRLAKRRPREVAQEELLRIAEGSARQPRPRTSPVARERHEGVPSGTRVLLRELHDGKCQLCAFTFKKRSGEPYFEIHHLDPEIGHHPSNLLLLCPNCHAQFEHAVVTDFKWLGIWLVAVVINGKRIVVRQPLAHDSVRRTLLGLIVAFAVTRIRRQTLW